MRKSLIISGCTNSPIDYSTGILCLFFSSSLSSSYDFKALKIKYLRELMSKKFVTKNEEKCGEVGIIFYPLLYPTEDFLYHEGRFSA